MSKHAISRRGNLALFMMLFCGLAVTLFTPLAASAEEFASPDFQKVWNRTDKQVAGGSASRTYLWGPGPFTNGVQEDYSEAAGGKRLVQYFDKSRMEITNPNGDKNSQYYVTNGLIAKELMSGKLQLGDNKFEDRAAANIGVAGDPDDTNGPTYKTLNGLILPTAEDVGQTINKAIDRAGTQRDGSAEFGKYNIKQAKFEAITGHNIAAPFWDFLNQSGQVLDGESKTISGRIFDPVYYATGLPITEAWWARVKVGGQVKDVLVQAFERRVLTYTPSNPEAYRVEMGNVGRHYYDWRYKTFADPTNPTTPTTPTSKCEGVPDAKNGDVLPGKCINPDSIIQLFASGFQAREQIGFWLNTPEGAVFGTRRTVNIGVSSTYIDFIDASLLWEGVWSLVVEGASSKNQSVVYFKIQKDSQKFNTCPDVPDPVNGKIRPAKCIPAGQPIMFDVTGFKPNEQVGFWLTDPKGNTIGTVRTVNIGPSGSIEGLGWATVGLAKGIWQFNFQSPSTKTQAIIYFKVE